MKILSWKYTAIAACLVIVAVIILTGMMPIFAPTCYWPRRVPILGSILNDLNKVNVPIDYYGRFIAQDGKGIAEVHFDAQVDAESFLGIPGGWGNAGSSTTVHVTSDKDGHFWVGHVVGESIRLKNINREGYILYPNLEGGGREYGSKNHYCYPSPSPADPVIMHMWRKNGEAIGLVNFGWNGREEKSESWDQLADLVESRGYIDGTEHHYGRVRIAVSRGKPKDPKAKRGPDTYYDWSFQIEIMDGGGIIPTDDAFLFLAPEKGYTSAYSFEMKATDPHWCSNIQKHFYIHLPHVNLYGAAFFEISTHWRHGPSAGLGGYANPTGSRNLEHEGSIP